MKDTTFNDILNRNGLSVPGIDYENEMKYKEILKKYIRPAKTMFGGSFSEVRDFNERLNRTMDSKLFILSGRYGISSENELIIPYSSETISFDILEKLNKKRNHLRKMTKISTDADYILLFLPRIYIEFFIKHKWFGDLPSYLKIIAITSKSFENEINKDNITILPRVGVARIGKKNREKILTNLEEEWGQNNE